MGRRVGTNVILPILSRPLRHAPVGRRLKSAGHSGLLREPVGSQVGIAFVTLREPTRWATLRQWGPTRRTELNGWLATRPTLPCTDDASHRIEPTTPSV